MTGMNRHQRRRDLAITIEQCSKCDGLNEPGKTEAAPGFGSIRSPVVIVGQSLCEKCMDTKVPFTGGSGRLIDASLQIAGLYKPDIFITNVVHCHPPPEAKKSHPEWIENCKDYLFEELEIVRPKLVIGLGGDAENTMLKEYGDVEKLPWQPFTAPKTKAPNNRHYLFMPHPSWILRQHDDSLEQQYIAGLASALRWAFDAR
ncbi:uracil-DNA glycosylase family protein [Mycobacterium sp. 4858]|uniref:uracil-DNA glycosylase family protein n=1 Tax=Mycobacterium sp. 4858 TaxID=2057185 RepID=UPI000C835DBB|nr:uracil-DNA glycosylase family protein [Mycobacterium sp. 4858]